MKTGDKLMNFESARKYLGLASVESLRTIIWRYRLPTERPPRGALADHRRRYLRQSTLDLYRQRREPATWHGRR